MVARCRSCKGYIAYPDMPDMGNPVPLYRELFPQSCKCGNVYVDDDERKIAYDDSSLVVVWNTVAQDWVAAG